MDYATRYPDAVPLKSIVTESVAEALVTSEIIQIFISIINSNSLWKTRTIIQRTIAYLHSCVLCNMEKIGKKETYTPLNCKI